MKSPLLVKLHHFRKPVPPEKYKYYLVYDLKTTEGLDVSEYDYYIQPSNRGTILVYKRKLNPHYQSQLNKYRAEQNKYDELMASEEYRRHQTYLRYHEHCDEYQEVRRRERVIYRPKKTTTAKNV